MRARAEEKKGFWRRRIGKRRIGYEHTEIGDVNGGAGERRFRHQAGWNRTVVNKDEDLGDGG